MKIIINGRLKISDVVKAARNKNAKIAIAPDCLPKIAECRDLVDDIVRQKKVVYGITTGFGKFSDVSINESDSKTLQKNLILSHACGVGQPFEPEIVRAMLVLRINALSSGNSGITLSTLNMMVELFNRGIIPVVPSQGSLGASGDLAPLAHMALPLLGEGEVYYRGKRMPSRDALLREGLSPIELTAKEGLALINGTQAMCAIAVLALTDAENLLETADITAALSMEALRGITDAFDPRIHALRGQKGQIKCAQNLLSLLGGSQRVTKQGQVRVQDAYALRCLPQVHGAARDALEFVRDIISREINAVTDNPLIFPDTGESFSGGNFHGQYLSVAMDYLGIALSFLAGISERRTERLVNPHLSGGLPAFLVKNGGLNSGFMIPQYVAASLVSENKVLSHPACVDSITSSGGQEDYVSMGMTAARKARQIVENVTNVLAVELFSACQAVEFGSGNLAAATQAVFDLVRRSVDFVENDKYMSPHILECAALVGSGSVVSAASGVLKAVKSAKTAK